MAGVCCINGRLDRCRVVASAIALSSKGALTFGKVSAVVIDAPKTCGPLTSTQAHSRLWPVVLRIMPHGKRFIRDLQPRLRADLIVYEVAIHQ